MNLIDLSVPVTPGAPGEVDQAKPVIEYCDHKTAVSGMLQLLLRVCAVFCGSN